MLCIALRAAFGRLSPFGRLSRPSNAGQAKKTRNPVGESRKAVWPRCPLGYSPLRGCALACALPYGLSCSRAALSNFSHRFLGDHFFLTDKDFSVLIANTHDRSYHVHFRPPPK